MSGYTDAEQHAMVDAFERMGDAEFLYMLSEGFDGPGAADGYISDRLAVIAVVLMALEAIEEARHG